MTDDEIHELLAGIAKPYLGVPRGHLAAPLEHVEAHGGDVEAVRTWVEANDGYVENVTPPPSRGLRPGRLVERAQPAFARFVFPASALEAGK